MTEREDGCRERKRVSVSVERVWRDIALSHPLLVGGVVSTVVSYCLALEEIRTDLLYTRPSL